MKQSLWRFGAGERSVGELIAAERQRQGITQGALARALGISAPNLSRIERGADLRVSTLLDIVRALGLEPMMIPKPVVSAVRAVVDEAVGDEFDARRQRGRFV